MNQSVIDFGIEDVVNRLDKIVDVNSRVDSDLIRVVTHNLADFLLGAYSCIQEIQNKHIQGMSSPSLGKLLQISKFTNDALSDISSLFKEYNSSEKNSNIPNNNLNKDKINSLLNKLDNISTRLPIRANDLHYILADDFYHLISKANFDFSMAYYNLNLEFSPHFIRDKYNLSSDLKRLWSDFFTNKSFESYNFSFLEPNLLPLITKQNYVKNVFLPLIANVNDHAFNNVNSTLSKLNQYGQNNNKIEITSVYQKDSGQMSFLFSDNGSGIDNNNLEKIFTGKSLKDNSKDHGIGLNGVKKFVESNGGMIWAHSYNGAKFYFTIPCIKNELGYYEQK